MSAGHAERFHLCCRAPIGDSQSKLQQTKIHNECDDEFYVTSIERKDAKMVSMTCCKFKVGVTFPQDSKDCVVGQWADWAPCNGKIRVRRRILLPPVNGGKECPKKSEQQSCSNCKIGKWGSWSACTESFRSRTRSLTAPVNGGTKCPNTRKQTQSCSDCVIGAWGSWTNACDSDENSRVRRRTLQPLRQWRGKMSKRDTARGKVCRSRGIQC